VKFEIRSELFEHGIFPFQEKFSNELLISVCKNLHLLSSIEYRISLAQWIEQACKLIPKMKEENARIYFLTYRALLEDIERQGASQPLPQYSSDLRDF